MKLTRKTWLAILAGAVLASPAAIAADHLDGPAVTADPTADITDVFSWMADATHVALVMNVNPFAAGPTGATPSKFSNVVKYVFHTTPWSAFGPAGKASGEIDVICQFAATSGDPSCWVEDMTSGTVLDYVTGTAAAAGTGTGITSASGNVQLFAGARNDPFFFNLAGFNQTLADVATNAGSLVFNSAGCPAVPVATAQILAGQLGHAADGGPAVDTFAGADVLSIVLNIKTSVLLGSSGDTLLSVWASTNN